MDDDEEEQHTIQRRNNYSRDLRNIVIYQHQNLRKGTADISKDLNMPRRVVQRILQTSNEVGESMRDRRTYLKPGRTCRLDSGSLEFMLELVELEPDIYLDEIVEKLQEVKNISVSMSTVQQTLKKLGITSKKLSKVAAERCSERRLQYLYEVGKEDPSRLVFGDESAVNLHTTYRSMGRSFRGQRAYMKAYFQRGTRYSVLPALSLDGYIHCQIVQGSFNGDMFKLWLQGLLEVMNPYPQPRSVLVMDNCAIHRVEGVQEMCNERGVKLLYLPPYSPDFNPIEESFSFMKKYIARHGRRFREDLLSKEDGRVELFLYEALDKVTPELAKAWFHHSGYV